MGITPESLNQLKSRFQLSSFVGTRVKLKRQGRNFSGLCPFHTEKSPSFIVNDAQGNYHCFGCHAHGDVISFIQLTENLSFPETVEKLASLAGITLSPRSLASSESIKAKKDIYDILEEATSFFQYCLLSDQGREALKYLNQRGITQETRERFRLGFAPSTPMLKSHFLAKGETEKKLLESGLLFLNEEKTKSFDRFQKRIIFPIWDIKGKPIAFGGRSLGTRMPKYLNSAETSLFHKGFLLYGYHLARKAAHDSQRLIVCEGYMDVIALHQAGITESVASLGTALTEEQIFLLWNLNPIPLLCFDGDSAGQAAAFRAAERVLPLLKPGYSLCFAHMPEGEDPDSLLRAGSKDRLETLFKNTTNLGDLLWHHILRSVSYKTPEERANLEKECMSLANRIKEPLIQKTYRQWFKNRLFEFFRSSSSSQNNMKTSSNIVLQQQVKTIYNPLHIQQKILFAGLLNHPLLLEEYYEFFLNLDLLQDKLEFLREAMIQKINDSPVLDGKVLQDHLSKEGLKEILDDLLNEDIYQHASFVRPQTDLELVRYGWLEVWNTLQQLMAESVIQNKTENVHVHSLSPLLRTIMKRDFL